MRYKLLLVFPVVALLVFLTVFGSIGNQPRQGEEHYETALRLIGHRLLLSARDSTSRVMPVKSLPGKQFQIQFENHVSLEPDSIFSIISNTTKGSTLPKSYVAKILDCSTNETVYSFVMSDIDSNVIVPCLRRTLPKGCYAVNIEFSSSAPSSFTKSLSIAGLILSVFAIGVYYYFQRRQKKRLTSEEEPNVAKNVLRIGEYSFYFEQRYLSINGETIDLTDKESKLLYIFASSPNTVINREQLQKEVWENEGVIVARSLDVFISKLRKKLEKDSTIRLVNVHSKGYKLETNA